MSDYRSQLLNASRPAVGLAAKGLMDLFGYESSGTDRDARAMAAASVLGEALIRTIKYLGG